MQGPPSDARTKLKINLNALEVQIRRFNARTFFDELTSDPEVCHAECSWRYERMYQVCPLNRLQVVKNEIVAVHHSLLLHMETV